MDDQERAKINVNGSTRDIWFTSIRKKSLKSEKKYEYHRQAEYHHTLNEEKLCQVPCPGLEPWTSRL